MPKIAAAATAFPEHYYSQAELCSAFLEMGARENRDLDRDQVRRFFDNVGVQGRHLALPLGHYADLGGFGARSATWLSAARRLGAEAVERALTRAQLDASQIALFASSTVTGIAVPSLEARLMNHFVFSRDCRRMPLFGLGCAAGAAGIARANDYLLGHPQDAAILLCVELCSLTFQQADLSPANLIACSLFGDAAGCVVLVGDEHPLAHGLRPNVESTRSVFFRDTEQVMGWEVVDNGLRVVLGPEVRAIAGTLVARATREFLASHGHTVPDVKRWVVHPGGPAIIAALEAGLELDQRALDLSRESLARYGNLSSVSVLSVLERVLEGSEPTPGETGVLMAMGPGFGAELALLRW